VSLGIQLASVLDSQFFPVFLGLIFYPLVPLLTPFAYFAHFLAAFFRGLLLIVEFECVVPFVFVKVE